MGCGPIGYKLGNSSDSMGACDVEVPGVASLLVQCPFGLERAIDEAGDV